MTTPNAMPKETPQDGARPEATLQEYLAAQGSAAQRAVGQLGRQISETLKDGADVRAWTAAYPWAAVGAAAAAGFGAAWLAGSQGSSSPSGPPLQANGHAQPTAAAEVGWAAVLTPIISVVGGIVKEVVAHYLSQTAHPAEPEQDPATPRADSAATV